MHRFYHKGGGNVYQQINNILSKVARSTESSFLAISAAQKSLSNIKGNPKAISPEDEEDILADIERAEEVIGELEGILIGWLKKFDLKDEVRFNI
jgi:hypothetical protein